MANHRADPDPGPDSAHGLPADLLAIADAVIAEIQQLRRTLSPVDYEEQMVIRSAEHLAFFQSIPCAPMVQRARASLQWHAREYLRLLDATAEDREIIEI